MLLESQIHGGVLMGVSYALYEERLLDRATGRMVNANLEQYKVAGPREVPQIDVTVIENYQGRSATDAYGIAEPANIATAPAIGAAVYNAIGVRLRALPMTQGCSVLRTLRGGWGFPATRMCESIGDNPNRRLSHVGVAIGDFAFDPGPPARRGQAFRSGDRVALRHSRHGCGGQFLPANP
jgi:hypothetical protein